MLTDGGRETLKRITHGERRGGSRWNPMGKKKTGEKGTLSRFRQYKIRSAEGTVLKKERGREAWDYLT